MAEISFFWFLPPVVAAISLVYSATRFETWQFIIAYAARWALYIVTFLAATWLFMFLLGLHKPWLVPIALGGLLFFLFGGSFKGKKTKADASNPSDSKSNASS